MTNAEIDKEIARLKEEQNKLLLGCLTSIQIIFISLAVFAIWGIVFCLNQAK